MDRLDRYEREQGAAQGRPRSKVVEVSNCDQNLTGFAECRNTYSALSALAGHYNNFGPDTNVPKKRLDRLNKVYSKSCTYLTTHSPIITIFRAIHHN